jgi:hypothetical protein
MISRVQVCLIVLSRAGVSNDVALAGKKTVNVLNASLCKLLRQFFMFKVVQARYRVAALLRAAG